MRTRKAYPLLVFEIVYLSLLLGCNMTGTDTGNAIATPKLKMNLIPILKNLAALPPRELLTYWIAPQARPL